MALRLSRSLPLHIPRDEKAGKDDPRTRHSDARAFKFAAGEGILKEGVPPTHLGELWLPAQLHAELVDPLLQLVDLAAPLLQLLTSKRTPTSAEEQDSKAFETLSWVLECDSYY